MRKWKKRLLAVVVGLVLAALAGGGLLYYMSQRIPTWYKPVATDSAEMQAAAQRALNKVVAIHNMADEAAAIDKAREAGTATTRTTVQPITVTFTQEELTGFVVHWSNLHSEKTDRYLTGPQFFLKDGQITFGAALPQLGGQFGSLSVEPSVDEQGQLHLDVASMNVGSLPAPRSLVQGKLAKVETMLTQWLPEWQQRAKIDSGGANAEAVKAAMTELLLNALHDKPSQAVFFMPIGDHKNVPVKLTDAKVTDGSLTLTVRPLSGGERKDALVALKEPVKVVAEE